MPSEIDDHAVIRAMPATRARADLYSVMGLSPRATNAVIIARHAIFNVCAIALFGSSPSNFTGWVLSADSLDLSNITNCMKSVIAAGECDAD